MTGGNSRQAGTYRSAQHQGWPATIRMRGDTVGVSQFESQTGDTNSTTTSAGGATTGCRRSVATFTVTKNTTTGARTGKTTAATPDDGQLKLAGTRLEHVDWCGSSGGQQLELSEHRDRTTTGTDRTAATEASDPRHGRGMK